MSVMTVPVTVRFAAVGGPQAPELRQRRAYWATAPAGNVRVGVDSGPLEASSGLENLADALRRSRDESQERVVASEQSSVRGLDALFLRSDWEEQGRRWRAVDLIWIAGDTAWHAWATAPADLDDSGVVALEEIVRRNAERIAGPRAPSTSRWDAAVKAWEKVRA